MLNQDADCTLLVLRSVGGGFSVAGAPQAFPFTWWDISSLPLMVLTHLSALSQARAQLKGEIFKFSFIIWTR